MNYYEIMTRAGWHLKPTPDKRIQIVDAKGGYVFETSMMAEACAFLEGYQYFQNEVNRNDRHS